MSAKPDKNESTARDIAAALADMRGRRDQTVAELDEKVQQLEALGEAFTAGALDVKAAQERLRRLGGEPRAQTSTRPVMAGRTQIGMRISAESTPVGAPQMTARVGGPTPATASTALERALTAVDTRLMSLLSRPRGALDREGNRIELGLLAQLRRSLEQQLADLPTDTILLASVIEYADEANNVLTELISGGSARARRLLEHNRELLAQLVAHGVQLPGLKDQLKSLKGALEGGPDAARKLVDDLGAMYARLTTELGKRDGATVVRSLFDELLGR